MSNPIVGETRHGRPTGRLESEFMEINVEAWNGAEWIPAGTEWVPITAEVRAQLERGAKPQVMSAEAVTEETRKAAAQDLLTAEQKLLRAIGLGDELPPTLKAAEEQLEHSGLGEALNAVIQDRIGTNPEDVLPTNAGRESITSLPEGYRDAQQVKEPLVFRVNGEDRSFWIDGSPTVVGHTYNLSELLATPNFAGIIEGQEVKAFYPPGKEVKLHSDPRLMESAGFSKEKKQLEHSGGNVSYYSVEVKNPKRPDRQPYIFEVEDLIETMSMTFHEGNVLKSLIRSVNERNHGPQKQGSDYIRDAEKMEHSSREELRRRRNRAKEGLK